MSFSFITNLMMLILFVFPLFISTYKIKPFSIGVCYYPEQYYSKEQWERDAKLMSEMGIDYVRIGEFIWSTIEPKEGEFDWTVLDFVFDEMNKYGIEIVLGTPTATPPEWLVTKYGGNSKKNTVLPTGKDGRVRTFGSRRHYSFSSEDYLKESDRIVSLFAKRYGHRENLIGYQIDNEYGCHETIRSYGEVDRIAFHQWLRNKYNNDIKLLNREYGNSFWSMDYSSFDVINLPDDSMVTEANPALQLDFYRFSSDKVAEFNSRQVEIILKHSKEGVFITTNFMGFFNEFDHVPVAKSLDLVSWDCYPLGVINYNYPLKDRGVFFKTGHPDFISFNDDLYSSMKKGTPIWIMEMQPGPVNWAIFNPAPYKGQIRLWIYQHFAHDVEVVSFFRWRRARFAQEQYHHALLQVDSSKDLASEAIEKVLDELENVIPELRKEIGNTVSQANIAILFSYETNWMAEILPQGEDYHYLMLVHMFYSCLRRMGVNVDFIFPNNLPNLKNGREYKVIFVPSLSIISEEVVMWLEDNMESFSRVVFGPRSGHHEENFAVPLNLPPGILQRILPIKITNVESFNKNWVEQATRPSEDCNRGIDETCFEDNQEFFVVEFGGEKFEFSSWREKIVPYESTEFVPIAVFDDTKTVAVFRKDKVDYVGFFPEGEFLFNYIASIFMESGMPFIITEEGVRVKERGGYYFVVNYFEYSVDFDVPEGAKIILGDKRIKPHDVLIYKLNE